MKRGIQIETCITVQENATLSFQPACTVLLTRLHSPATPAAPSCTPAGQLATLCHQLPPPLLTLLFSAACPRLTTATQPFLSRSVLPISTSLQSVPRSMMSTLVSTPMVRSPEGST